MPKSQESINPQIAFEDVLRLAEVHGLKAPYEMRRQKAKKIRDQNGEQKPKRSKRTGNRSIFWRYPKEN